METATTSIGSLTAPFTPTVTSCSTWFLGQSHKHSSTNHTWLQLGTVGPAASNCFPSAYNWFNGYYSPGVCPHGYEYACSAGIFETATVATCCPRCQNRLITDLNACITNFASNTYLSIAVWTTMSDERSEFVSSTTFAQSQGERGWAHGVIVRRAGNDPTWPGDAGASATATATTKGKSVDSNPETPSSGSGTSGDGGGVSPNNGGLSSGAQIGIGVGIAVGSAFIGGSVVGAYLFGKRRTRNRKTEEARRMDGSQGSTSPTLEVTRYVEVAGSNDETIGRHPRELPAHREPAELDAIARK
ncbi:hypothetical protein PG996_003112 [Apiospora saccharicola]|uniref:Uncharacterized protein n=1 Tax=Apiospora saccharicola TaxID=335842 RepID=A0ABR1W1K6_9PEZI